MLKKSWCDECKMMTYGCNHPVAVVKYEPTGEEHNKSTAPKTAMKKPGMLPIECRALIAACAEAMIAAEPLHGGPFKIHRLVVDPLIAPYFKICGITVGKNHQMLGFADVGAMCFPPIPEKMMPINNLPTLDVIMPGMLVTLRVRNIDQGGAHSFSGMFYGDMLVAPPIR